MLLVRSYRNEDLNDILKLHTDTVLSVNSKDYSPEQIAAWSYKDEQTAALWKNVFNASYTLVAENSGVIVGFANLFIEQAYLDRLFVHKDYQRQGVAHALLAAIIEKAESEHLPKLTVESSITARPFFEHSGFHVILQQQKAVRDGVTLLNYIMERALNSSVPSEEFSGNGSSV
jgi:putative acetyltransferase